TSPDGLTWTKRVTEDYSGFLNGAAFGKETFVVVGHPFYGPGTVLQSDPFRQAPQISVSPSSLNFGDINTASSSDKSVTVGNTGDATLVLGAVTSPSSPFNKTADDCSSKSLAPGSNCSVTYRFSPSAEGTFSGNSNIPSNDPDKPQVTVTLTGKSIVPVDRPNLTPYQPSGWSDKLVISKTSGTNTDSTAFYSTDTLYLDWAVINNGKATASKPFVTHLYLDGILRKEWTTNSLDVNQRFDITDFLIGTLEAGQHLIEIAADFNDDINESDELDNVYDKTITVEEKPIDKPNLALHQPSGWSDGMVISKTKGAKTGSSVFSTTDTIYLNWSIINNGKVGVSKPFVTQLYVDGELKKEWTTDSLNVDQHVDVTDFSIGSLEEGEHLIEIAMDFNDDIDESDEDDNYYDGTIKVEKSLDGPDLTGEWVSLAQKCSGSGSKQKCKLTVSLNVKNVGNKDVTKSSTSEVYLESDDIEDTLMKRISVGKIKKGGSKTFKFTYSLPTGANAKGRYVVAVIDVDNAVEELDEQNNDIFYDEVP
ncbi:MAG: choice-of-anchor D domain-containing protein, partial [Deltaproteobacteria bacterium]